MSIGRRLWGSFDSNSGEWPDRKGGVSFEREGHHLSFMYTSHKSKHGRLRQPSGCIEWTYTITSSQCRGEGGEWEPLSNTHKHVHTHKHTHLMVTTWLEQNKAFRQALFSAELIFQKRLRALSRSQDFFSARRLSISKLLLVYTFSTSFWRVCLFRFLSESCTLFRPTNVLIGHIQWTGTIWEKRNNAFQSNLSYVVLLL